MGKGESSSEESCLLVGQFFLNTQQYLQHQISKQCCQCIGLCCFLCLGSDRDRFCFQIIFNENLQWDGASLYFWFCLFLNQCICAHKPQHSHGHQGMASGVHPHPPPCLRQVLFVVHCFMHQASWPVHPPLPPIHCRTAGITGANSLIQLLQGLRVFRLWTSCLCGHLPNPHVIFRVEIKYSSGHCSDQSRSESLASLSHFILELW